MITHELKQGSKEWHAHRLNYFNASDAPAMMGLSVYKSRTKLLNELHTGIKPDLDSSTQKRFSDGHRFELLARPIAEKIIGSDLYPITGSMEEYSASFDGITMDEKIVFEHKTLNDELRSLMFDVEGTPCGNLPIMYRVQMEQQLMISGAEKCLFMASKWDGDTLIEERHCWYCPDLKLRKEIGLAWIQFKRDLANHAPHETIEIPKATTILALPSLAIQIRGEVMLSNLPEFKEAATDYIASIKTEFVTDEDFSNGEAAAKFCKEAEDNIEQAKRSAIAQTSSIDELMRTLDFIKGQLRDKRLIIEKLVSSEKENRKLAIINAAKELIANHVVALAEEIKPITMFVNADFSNVIKSKKTLSSMQSAVNDELARAKIEADAIARDIRSKLVWYNETAADFKNLFADLQILIYKPSDDFQLAVTSRIEAQKKLEAARAAKEVDPIKCDGNHGGKPCGDRNCWQLDDPLSAAENGLIVPPLKSTTAPPKTPCASEIAVCVGEYFNVDFNVAMYWLQNTDFTQLQQVA